MKKRLIAIVVSLAGLVAFAAAAKSYYCQYCGFKANSVRSLTAGKCLRHPDGAFKGNHVLYEGSEKAEHVCKHCGYKANSIRALTAGKCLRHPNGAFKGPHAPAL